MSEHEYELLFYLSSVRSCKWLDLMMHFDNKWGQMRTGKLLAALKENGLVATLSFLN